MTGPTSGVNAKVVQLQLDREYPGANVRGAFAVDTRPPEQRGLDRFGGGGSELELLLLPIALVVAGVEAFLRWRKDPEGTRYLVVVTDRGTALARCRGSVGGAIRRWVHGPIGGLRYELDPGDARTGAAEVEITLGDDTFWAGGTHRDAAFQLFGLQMPRNLASPADPPDQARE